MVQIPCRVVFIQSVGEADSFTRTKCEFHLPEGQISSDRRSDFTERNAFDFTEKGTRFLNGCLFL